jgi:exonuclease III
MIYQLKQQMLYLPEKQLISIYFPHRKKPIPKSLCPNQRVFKMPTIYHINVEGFSSSKSDFLARLMLEEKVDVIAVQETHTASAESLRRGNLTRFTLVGDVYSSVHGNATYIRSDLSNWRIVYQVHTNNVHVLAVELHAIIIVNVYKPPSSQYKLVEQSFENIFSSGHLCG